MSWILEKLSRNDCGKNWVKIKMFLGRDSEFQSKTMPAGKMTLNI